ncbi:hypothetical protein [Sporosarcina sp. Marseille-Q4943]|uniref:hypothetical protein n=1 Tax=Sporosarcina sp. Marseille-Q4943 TaxID=2942204 RepID=UPI00208DDA28|nr:hypothetical protein [Sporosarcina sp. Marseille-Q4943]
MEEKQRAMYMIRIFFFLISYGLIVITVTHMIFYFNYLSLGYSWKQILLFIVQTGDFMLFIMAVILLVITVFARVPSQTPFF